jgi:transposase
MFEQVKTLASQGISVNETARRLRLAKKTIRKYRQLEHLVDHRENPEGSYVEPYREYLEKRWAQGPVAIKTLWQELQAQGFVGGYNCVWRFVRQWPLPPGSQPALTPLPGDKKYLYRARTPKRSPFRVARLLSSQLEDLSETDRTYREALCCLSPQLALAADLSAQFRHLMNTRTPEDVPAWLEKAKASHLEAFRRFAIGLENEQDAFIAALTESWSNGQVEGQITRLKYLKRQMYGRAKIDLLRLRVLHPT